MAITREKVLKTIDFLRRRSVDYRVAAQHPAVQRVLIDLAQFCCADKTTIHPDARVSDVLAGRREVWLRIQQHLHLTPAQLLSIYAGKEITVAEIEND